MKQTIVIERNSFDFELTYIGKARVLKIIERRKKSFVASIWFRASLVPWFCSIIDQACREAIPSHLSQTKDEGNKIILIKGGSNDEGKYLKISEILSTGKE